MPEPTPDTVHRIPLVEIDAAALTRDRSGLDEDTLAGSKTAAPKPPHRYGLLSGLRRLHAFQALSEQTGQDRYAAIPAFLRPRGTMAEALASMVEENEIRAAVTTKNSFCRSIKVRSVR